MLAGTNVVADIQIHRCLLDDGTTAFQETPCEEPVVDTEDDEEAGETADGSETPAANNDPFDFVNPFDEPAGPPMPSEPALPELVSRDRAECEKMTRDAIDAIDLEMREKAYTNEEGQKYLAELLELTRQLRACKKL